MTREEMEQQFKENQALVTFTIQRWFPSCLGDEDIFQIGNIGLWLAVKNHNPEKGKFSGYAVMCIKNEICRHFQALNTIMRKGETSSLDEVIIDKGPKGHTVHLYDIVRGEPDISFFDAEGILSKLDKKNRFILARLAKGYNQRDIAAALGCTMQSISLRVKEIRRIVKKYV